MKQMFLIPTVSSMDAFAKKLSMHLSLGMVVTLSGSLGSGKTTLVQALGKYLGVTSRIISPTFTLMKIYPLPYGRLLHVDAYRLDSLLGLGLEDETGDDTLTMIEWPEKIKVMPEGIQINLTLTVQEDQTRLVTVQGPIPSIQV
jgi:tRNA threonylcarbamoyladenosine biosynthesis protein TsaE